ncbi:MAG TPA: SDR family NAD(P)-dependent oxidoreductase [Gammaproteobacteria bacterium]|nr:SDR family NAD(P)-dependent oxidoreductase [Gammaproteobacteria bacterium]
MSTTSASPTTTGRRAAVTGAASGIGAATARLLQAQGWRVACLDRNLAGARATAGQQGVAVEVDVADEASVVRAFKEVEAALGGLDALVAAAGIINTTPFFETTVAELRTLFDVNVIGSFLTVREGAKYMQKGARICMVASISSYTGGGYVARGAYATSKGAVLTMMKSCARELGPKGIAVNAVAPGFIDTPFVASAMSDPKRRKEVEAAVGKIGTAEQIAECCAWLVSPAADFVHGETLIADGGILLR